MISSDVRSARQIATSLISSFPPPTIDDPIYALATLNWFNAPTSPELILCHRSFNFDDGAWLSRLALAGAYLEKYFPDCKIQCAEVLENPYLEPVLVEFKSNPSLELFKKIRDLEKPYFTIIIQHKIFDLFGFSFGQNIVHTKVNPLPFWPAVAAFREVLILNQAKLNNTWFALDGIEKICPNSVVISEEKASQLFKQNELGMVLKHLTKCVELRPTISSLYILYFLTGNPLIQKQIIGRYSDKVFRYVHQHLIQ